MMESYCCLILMLIYIKMIDKNAQNIYAIPNPIPNISSKVSIECKKIE